LPASERSISSTPPAQFGLVVDRWTTDGSGVRRSACPVGSTGLCCAWYIAKAVVSGIWNALPPECPCAIAAGARIADARTATDRTVAVDFDLELKPNIEHSMGDARSDL